METALAMRGGIAAAAEPDMRRVQPGETASAMEMSSCHRSTLACRQRRGPAWLTAS
jgi:hypothetical protein